MTQIVKSNVNVALPSKKGESYVPPVGKLILAPIRRMRRGTPVYHQTNFLFEDSNIAFGVPIKADKRRTMRDEIFESPEEQAYLERELGEDLNIHKTKNNFFSTYRIVVGSEKEEYDLSIPEDLLAVRVLQSNKDKILLQSGLDVKDIKVEYLYSLTPEGEELDLELYNAEINTFLYSFYSKNKENRAVLVSVLTLMKNFVPAGASLKFLNEQLFNQIKTNPTELYNVLNDPDIKERTLYDRALTSRAIYVTDEGIVMKGSNIPFADNKTGVIRFFKDPKNSTDVAQIKAWIKQFEDSAGELE